MDEPKREPADIGNFNQTTPAAPSGGAAAKALQSFMGSQNPLGVDGGEPQEETALPDVQSMSPEELEKGLAEAVDSVDQAPEKTWEQQLKELDITQEEAFKIIDIMMTKGHYEKTYPVTKKVSVTFRTRDFDAHERTQKALEADSPQFYGTVSMIMSKYNLAASLRRYGTRDFKPNKQGQPVEAFNFIAGLSYMVFSLLLQKLAKFDELVLTVMDEGALENF